MKRNKDISVYTYIQVPDEEVRYFYNNRWSKIPESDRYLPLEEGLNRVAEGRLAYHTMIDSAYPHIEHSFNRRSICELTEVHLFRAVLAFYARHRSPFTELMKVGYESQYTCKSLRLYSTQCAFRSELEKL